MWTYTCGCVWVCARAHTHTGKRTLLRGGAPCGGHGDPSPPLCAGAANPWERTRGQSRAGVALVGSAHIPWPDRPRPTLGWAPASGQLRLGSVLPRPRPAWPRGLHAVQPGVHPAAWTLPAREEVPAQPLGRANTSGRSGPLDYLLGTNFLPQKNHRVWRKNKQPFRGAALSCPQEGSRSQKSPRGSQAPRAQRPRELVKGCPGQCRPPPENACADWTDRELQAGRQSGPGHGSGTAGVHAFGKVSGRHQEPTRAHRKAGTPGYTHFLSGRAGWWGGYCGACGAWPAAPGSPMGHRAGPVPHRCPLLVDGRWTGPPRPRAEKPPLVSPEPLAAPSLPGDSRPLLPGP
ncbi:uncharacterized protein LOC121016085 [Herpailurus yagouaroundi]|uniref:uncharacterized protein LOC121016085 n=1 Tax=Herpailurus yagouaroundi TaxID=1608482 RepID=UPI001AD6D6AA|nr:uncharacterized protein LOC121016085 [Puma yagouaroundi]